MKFGSTALLRYLVFSAVILSSAIADLNSDKQALLDFAASVPHRRNLRWDPTTPVCTSWLGVTCTDDNQQVLSLRLPGVGLVGPIPAQTLGKLDGLEILSLRSNLLSGDLPEDVASLPKLRLLYLQHNNFSGEIPSTLSLELNVLDLSFNSFAGEIPRTLKNLTELTGLNLVNNSLAGPIPELGSGIKHLNLSYNNLNGSVPTSLRTFPGSSFVGNLALCGPPLGACSSIVSISPPSSDHVIPDLPRKGDQKRKLPRWAVIAIIAGASAVLLALAVLLVLCCCCCKKKRDGDSAGAVKAKSAAGEKPREAFGSGVQEAEKNKLVFFEGCSFNFDLEDLLRASAEVLGKGSYGTAYKAILEEATTVVVKRLKEVVVTKKDFDNHMETVGRVGHHPNVMPLRAYYYSKDEKLLVYDYVSRGSLSALLHGNRGAGRTPLDWETRVKITLHTAKGLAHIHRMGGPKFSHGNVKATNVLLLPDNDACVSDFGLSPLMTAASTASSSSAAAGYRAPEVVEARKYSHKSDVYSFGVLVLEMLTGKAPQMSPGRDDAAAVDLPRWVHSVVREEWTAEVFDVELMRYNDIEEEMVQMLQIAMACVAKVPDSRPTMDEVVRMIDDIRHNDSDNRPSSEDNVKSKDSNPNTP